jgi:hypothetical protein
MATKKKKGQNISETKKSVTVKKSKTATRSRLDRDSDKKSERTTQMVVATMKRGDTGPQVVILQDALFALLKCEAIKPHESPNFPTKKELEKLSEDLKKERAQSLFGEATLKLVIYFQVQRGLGDNLKGVVEEKTAAKINEVLKSECKGDGDEDNDDDEDGDPTGPKSDKFIVRGQILLSNGSPCAGAFVRAYDKDLRSKEPLGKSETVTTDKKGQYEITYTAEQFARVEKRSADLLVEARKNAGAVWIAAPIHFNAQPIEVVDITLDGVYRGPSEFRRLVDEIAPLLDGLTLAQLTENSEFQDITFLSNETGVDRQLIALLAVSALRAQEEDILQHEEYYGLFRQTLPTTLDALLKQETDALSRALENSARDNIIRSMTEEDIADFVLRVWQLKARRVLRPGGADKPASLGDLLALVINDTEKQKLIAKLFLEQGGATDAFWKTLEENSNVTPDDMKSVKHILALGDFTDNYLPLISELYQLGKDTSVFAELRGFSQWDEEQWQTILSSPQANSKPIGFPPGQDSIQSYAHTLNLFIETTFPTAVITNRIERDNSNESPFKEAKSDLLTFFSNNPEFSFTGTPLALYLSEDADGKLREIENPDILKTQLKGMQRVFNITPRFPVIRALLADDLHSATAIVHVGESKFSERYAVLLGGISNAREAYRKAEHVHATALNVYMKHAEAFNSPTPYVISGGDVGILTPQTPVVRNNLSEFSARNLLSGADWRNLFGSLDLCDCRHCQSLYSPAAYLVDILKFLDIHPTTNGALPRNIVLNQTIAFTGTSATIGGDGAYVGVIGSSSTFSGSGGEMELSFTGFNFGHSNGPSSMALDVRFVVDGVPLTATRLQRGSQLQAFATLPAPSAGAHTLRLEVRTVLMGGPPIAATLSEAADLAAEPPVLLPISPLDVLLTRRPDIEHIELTCENTNTQLPYVDLTNEILEAAIVPRSFVIAEDGGIDIVLTALSAGEVPSSMKAAFASNGYVLSDKASLRRDAIAGSADNSRWIILDSGWAFTLKHQGTNEGFLIVAWPQTSWTSDELRANPEHTHDPAYVVLSSAVYPWNLPLNLPVEEMRVYLEHLGVPRRELVEAFFLGAPSAALSDAEITYEYLGLGKEEANIVAGRVEGGPIGTTPTLGAWNFWGLLETGNPTAGMVPPPVQSDWDVVLQRVSIFLQQSGLSYKELLELLGTYFINPPASAGTPGGRLLGIVSIDADPTTCNLSKLEIQVVDSEIGSSQSVLIDAWDRIHRFVRLWRKLGWTMRDLDKAITSLPKNVDGYIDIEDLLLNNLSHVQRLHVATRLPVVKLLSWWGDIDTGNYVDHLVDGEPAVASLFEQLFNNKTVSGQVLSETGVLSGTLAEKAAAIAAALQISVEDLTLLLAAITNDGTLTLANLSLLYRHAGLAKVLKLPIRTYLTALDLVDSVPFATPASTIQFIKHIENIRTSGFTVEDLDYLLRNKISAKSNIAATDEVIAIALDAMRDDLRKVSAENTFVATGIDDNAATSDPNGELTRKKLALLNWDAVLIEKVVAVLNDTVTYETMLTNLATTVVFPESLKSRISYDKTDSMLRFTGTMTASEQALLIAPPNTDALFTAAVGELFKRPKEFVLRYMARFSVPVFPVPITDTNLKILLTQFNFPEALKNKIYYETLAGTLHFVGVMTEAERGVLSKLLPLDNEYLKAIQALFDAPKLGANKPLGVDIFLTSAAADKLFDDPNDTPQVRFLLVLKELLPYLKSTLSEIVLKQRLGEYLKLDATVIDGLLKKWIKPQVVDQAHPERKALADFLDPTFAESNPNIMPSKDAFPQQFNALLLLYKIAMIVQKFNITSQQLPWLFDSMLNAGWLDLNVLPLGATPPTSSLFPGWERLTDLFQLRDSLPSGEALLADVFTSATAPGDSTAQLNKVLEILSKGAQWEPGSLKSLSDANGFNFSVSDFAGESAIRRLAAAFSLLQRLGASADQCLSWAKPYPTSDDARELKSLVRAKYDDAEWQELAKSLRDTLRERQRSALVAYLMQKLDVRDADDLHDHFLIDVAMSPCMMTTRIKQAISSVQLFIQRGLMNLEKPEVSLSPENAREWGQWRKQYRVWEANRKVLLYPENWIEPELRDDKSPFYKDLENELLQSDVTMATAEDAFVHYLEKLDQVARLDIVGMYRQEPEDILHVFGRTYAIPHIYFYRRLEGKVWSAWEKADLDIEGDHLIPVAWNRRLYLFWAIFTEKSEQPTKAQRKNDQDPNKYWEIKLASSEYKNGSWTPKKISKKPLRYNMYPYSPTDDLDAPPVAPQNIPQDPQNFSFKTRTQGFAGDQLTIECYGPKVDKRLNTPPPPPIPVRPVNVQTFGVLVPHDFLGLPLPTYIRCRFQIGNGKAGKSQATLEIRDSSGVKLESVTLNSNGIAYSTKTYTAKVFGWLVSDDYELESFTEEGSWWFAGIFPSPTHIAAQIEAISDVVSDITAGFPANAGTAFIATGLPTYGRGMTIKLKARTPLPQVAPPTAVSIPTASSMQGIGEFTLNDCNGELAVARFGEMGNSMTPAALIPYPYTNIQSMQFVETSGVHPLVTPPPGRGDSILSTTPGTFRLLAPHQGLQFTFQSPFFFQDVKRTYFVSLTGSSLRFAISFHPRVCDFIKAINRHGVPGLLTLQNQLLDDHGAAFWTEYSPAPIYQSFDSVPKEDVDFENTGTYSLYNWELFFHTPFLIAMQLSKNQRFEEAQKWFHYIFDPTATDSPGRSGPAGIERFWRVKPFYEEAVKPIQTLEALIADSNALSAQVTKWEADPFKPHAIARMRVVAYMKAVVMRYIDNLIEWGDQLFRRDTIESINEATQLYILAGQILGRRPEGIPARVKAKIQTFRTLDDMETLDSLSNAKVEIESFLAPSVAPSSFGAEGSPPLKMRYFCITGNDKLLGYWDTVSDRLFKIRHCMNIEGVERSLPIFEPPIDPALLVRAAAAGVDIASALNDINAPIPHYRFNVMMQKASELCSEVKAMGGAVLSALEKRDAEALALLRSSHEVELLKAVREIKQQQIDETNNTLHGLMQYQNVVTTRQQYYLSRPFMNPFEIGHIVLTTSSLIPMAVQIGAEQTATVGHALPNAKIAAPTSVGTTYGGENVGNAAQSFGKSAGTVASMLNTAASMSASLGSYQRRQDDWTHQADLATKELKQVEKQIAAAEIRLAISEKELQNHDQQIENAKEVDDYMRHRKFTNQELYSWMVGQLSGIYFQSYQLAYDVAKRAERTYRYELGLRDSNFIQFGYWDSLRKGLLSGERLYHDLKRMDVAYLDKNKREHEITKHISLITIDPFSLVKLKETGECFVNLPEALFDIDYPGHYMRRIKSVSITIPCVTGPYASVNCTLTQLSSSIRHANTLSGGPYRRSADDARFSDSFGSIQSIVTSSGQNDSGLFEANLRDERYLPFEGQGAISAWRIQLPKEFKSFDYDTISDVVLHLRYTARDAGGALRKQATGELSKAVNNFVQSGGKQGLTRIFSLRHEFPTEWYRFLNPIDTADRQTLELKLTQDRFPLQFRGRMIAIKRADVFLKFKDISDSNIFNEAGNTHHTPLGAYQGDDKLKLGLTLTGDPRIEFALKSDNSFLNGLPRDGKDFSTVKDIGNCVLDIVDTDLASIAPSLRSQISVSGAIHWRLKPEFVEDIFIVYQYSV